MPQGLLPTIYYQPDIMTYRANIEERQGNKYNYCNESRRCPENIYCNVQMLPKSHHCNINHECLHSHRHNKQPPPNRPWNPSLPWNQLLQWITDQSIQKEYGEMASPATVDQPQQWQLPNADYCSAWTPSEDLWCTDRDIPQQRAGVKTHMPRRNLDTSHQLTGLPLVQCQTAHRTYSEQVTPVNGWLSQTTTTAAQ